MDKRLQTTVIAAIVSMIVVPIAIALMGNEWAVIVLSEIAVIGFFTVIFIMVIGSMEAEAHPQTASESPSVKAWRERLGESTSNEEKSESAS